MSDTHTTVTASSSAPPAAPVDVSMPKPSLFWTRLFSWAVAVATLALWYSAIGKGSANVWPYCTTVCFLIFAYVLGARATDVVQLVQSSGIIRAAQATATAVTNAADAATAIVHQVVPAAANPTPRVAGND